MNIEVFIQIILWLFGFVFLWRVPVCQTKAKIGTERKSLSVIIPARNEANNIPILLTSLKSQLQEKDEVIVVDDQSEDGTSAVAGQYGAKVIASEPLPSGWRGKTWAGGVLHWQRLRPP